MNAALAEEALIFGCEGERLVGILHMPLQQQEQTATQATPAQAAQAAPAAQPAPEMGVVVIVGGPQYRVGSHRQFVLLARALAAAGYPVLRFDYRGMGDSGGAARSFEHLNADIKAAIDVLQQRLPSVRRVMLWGLCDGASAALLYADATRDQRVAGACVLNPWVRSEASLATTQLKHYYTRRLLAPEFWAKLLSGKVTPGAMLELMQKLRQTMPRSGSAAHDEAAAAAIFQQRMAYGWQHLGERILLILSGKDYTAKEFIEYTAADDTWRRLLCRSLRSEKLPDADHTFSDGASRGAVEKLTIDWLQSLQTPLFHR